MRKKFEYHFEEVDTEADSTYLSAKFGELGQDSWELVVTYKKHESWSDYVEGRDIGGVNHFNVFVFKRELE